MSKRKDPVRQLHKIIKKNVKESLSTKIDQLKYRLEVLEEDILEEVYTIIGHEIDDAIEEAYNQGIEVGRSIND